MGKEWFVESWEEEKLTNEFPRDKRRRRRLAAMREAFTGCKDWESFFNGHIFEKMCKQLFHNRKLFFGCHEKLLSYTSCITNVISRSLSPNLLTNMFQICQPYLKIGWILHLDLNLFSFELLNYEICLER